MNCPNCSRSIPADSKLCPYCGARVAETAVEDRPATGPTTRLEADDQLARPAATEPAYWPAAPVSGQGFGRAQAMPIGAIWLIGIAVLAITGLWWPGILVLIGLTSFVSMMNRGPSTYSISPLVFFIGLAIIAWFDWWWPGMLILIGVMMLINAGTFRGLAGR